MKNTTLCYLLQGEQVLLLHRVKKENDLNHDKWIGIGGKFEECLLREAWEETGLTLTDYRYRGIVTFVSNEWEGEYMHLYTATGWTGALKECNEGVLEWVSREKMKELPQWEGDKIFFRLMEQQEAVFSLKLRYVGDALVEKALDGKAF